MPSIQKSELDVAVSIGMVEHGTAERDHVLVTLCRFSLVLQRRVERSTDLEPLDAFQLPAKR